MRSRFLLILFSLLISGGVGTGCGVEAHPSRGCRQGQTPFSVLRQSQAPDFSLPLAAPQTASITLSELNREHPVLLVFWATWCPACIEEIPTLNAWHRQFSSEGLKILGINVQEPRQQVLKFIREDHAMDYPIALDEEGKTADQFGLVGLPSAVFLAKGGKILYYGFSLPPNMEQLLSRIR